MSHIITFLIGAALGGAGVGWVMYNKLGKIKAAVEKLGLKV